MNRCYILGCLAIGLLFAQRSLAFDAYDSFEHPGDVYVTSTGWAASGNVYAPFQKRISASRFTSLASGQLAVIRIALKYRNAASQPGLNQIDVRLHSAEANGDLGPVIAAFTRSGLPAFGTGGASETIFNSDPSVVLTAGLRYWIAVAPGADTTLGVWNHSTSATGQLNRLAISDNDGASYFYLENQIVGAMRLEVIPEPASLALLTVGIATLLLARQRRR